MPCVSKFGIDILFQIKMCAFIKKFETLNLLNKKQNIFLIICHLILRISLKN
jgi:hypothetical protein